MMKIRKEDLERIEDQSPLELFRQGIKSTATRISYERTLRTEVMEIFESELLDGDTFDQKLSSLLNHTRQNPKWTVNLFLKLSEKLKQRTELPPEDPNYLNPATVTKYFKPLKKLFSMNDVPFSWNRIYATFPELNNNNKTRGYTREEIQKLLKFANGAVERFLILILASSGIRLGGLELKWEDVQPVYVVDDKIIIDITESQVSQAKILCGMILVYQGTFSQYTGFITSEAYHALLDYKSEWIQEVGREPKPQEPIFKREGSLPIKAKPTALKQRMERLVCRSGLRTPLVKGKRRHEIPIMNGFRRFWNKTCKEALSKDSPLASLIKKEYMMGHTGLIKLDKNYFQSNVTELVEEYLTVIPSLTISNELRQENDIKTLRDQQVESEKKIHEVENLKASQQILLDLVLRNERKKELTKEERLKYQKALESLGYTIGEDPI